VHAERADPVFATGAWLGAAQASLGFALLIGVSASALVYFALLAGWIAAGALGAAAVDRSRDGAHFAGAVVAMVATRVLAVVAPFSTPALLVALACCALCGSYAGFFIARAGRRATDQRAFLLRENNGFVVGFAVASLLLFVSVHTLDAALLLSGLALLVVKLR
jgi:hypothetical protein